MKILALVCICTTLFLSYQTAAAGSIHIYDAPKGERISNAYYVTVNNHSIPVYNVRIGAADNNRRFKAVDDLLNSAVYFDNAAFSYFDLKGNAKVQVGNGSAIKSCKILPNSTHVKATINGKFLTFSVDAPINLTIEINGEWVKSLHLFVNPFEENIPDRKDPNVIYFGPGIHEISNLVVGDNKTIYIAGGAILKAIIGKDEKFGIEPSGLKNYSPRILLLGNHIKIRGRGIIDASEAPVHAGNFITLKGSDIQVEGIIIRNSCGWTLPLRQCNNININNIKILGYRANSDGIDICNSSNVIVENCFIRTNDDLVVVKTFEHEGRSKNVTIRKCILWNQLAHALSLGAELRENVENIYFLDCDVIHDQGREWALRIFHSDSSTISNVVFNHIRVEDTHNLISLWIGKMASSSQPGGGTIQNILFSNITALGYPISIVLTAADKGSAIKHINFNHVIINNVPLEKAAIIQNGDVSNVKVIN